MTFEESLDAASIAGSTAEPAGTVIDALGTLYYTGKAGYNAATGQPYGDDLTTAGFWGAGTLLPFGAGALASKVGKPILNYGKKKVGSFYDWMKGTDKVIPFKEPATMYNPRETLYRVVDAKDKAQAIKYGSTIPDVTTTGRRTGLQGRIKENTDFDHISATTDQSWITKGRNNLFDRYGGKNPYVVKIKGHRGKIHDIGDITNDNLAKIRPGSYTNMNVSGPQYQNITSIIGPKGSQVSEVLDALTKEEYLKLLNDNPNFIWKYGGMWNPYPGHMDDSWFRNNY